LVVILVRDGPDGVVLLAVVVDLARVPLDDDLVKSDLRARPIYHHKRDSIEASPHHRARRPRQRPLAQWRTNWSIKKLITSLRRYHTIEIQAGDQIVTAAEPLPDDIGTTLHRLHGSE
jgi:hypothetical protein